MRRQRGLQVVLAIEFAILAITGWQTIVQSGTLNVDILWIIPPLGFTLVGALVAWQRPDNRIGWIFLLPVGFMGLLGFGALAEDPKIQTALGSWVIILHAITSLGWTGLLGTMLTLTWLYFPDGRLPSTRWRPLVWMIALGILLAATSDFQYTLPPGANTAVLSLFRSFSEILLLGSALGSFASLYHRHRRGREIERQQIRWIVSSAALTVLVLILIIALENWFTTLAVGAALDVVFVASITLVPTAAGIAILRHRLFDIDLIIRRTVIYGVLTLLLLLTFYGSVTILNGLLTMATGPQSQIATVVSTLAIAGLFTPLRRRVQAAVDRRFYRRKYNADLTLRGFSSQARNEVDLDELSRTLLAVVDETMQPGSGSLWLKESPG